MYELIMPLLVQLTLIKVVLHVYKSLLLFSSLPKGHITPCALSDVRHYR